VVIRPLDPADNGGMTRQQFRAAVSAAAAGTPYAVTPTDQGFDVGLDLANASWYTLYGKAGLAMSYTHHVRVQEGWYSITDDSRGVRWGAGVPGFSGSSSRSLGRLKTFGAQKSWALDEHGRLRPVVEFRFDSEEGRQLITGVAEQLGLTQRRGTAEKIGLVAAIIGGGGAVVTAVSLLVMVVLGKF
jgi:hypothetical protein